jgi:hypothetical protein
MDIEAERSLGTTHPSLASRVLIVAALGCIVAAGLLLWSRQGDAVFSDMVLTALAWCF